VTRKHLNLVCILCAIAVSLGADCAHATDNQVVLTRKEGTVVLEPYAPGIIRVSIGDRRDKVVAPAGYGFIGVPTRDGWRSTSNDEGDVFTSSQLVVTVAADSPHVYNVTPVFRRGMMQFFGKVDEGPEKMNGPKITIATPDGKTLLVLKGWKESPLPADSPEVEITHSPELPGATISATFASPSDEMYFGLGQHQDGAFNLRHRVVSCWHDYNVLIGQTNCVPFLVSSYGYGLAWDNPSKTTIKLGFNEVTTWSSEVGDRISFFVIAGVKSDDIYTGYRKLTGVTHLLPKSAYGFIQSKAIYSTREELMAVAKGYRERNLPADVLVVDFMNMTHQGNFDLDPTRWPDPAEMSRQLHALGFETLISSWPHFALDSRPYSMLLEKGWLVHRPDGSPNLGWAAPTIGPNLDMTNPDAARWFWNTVRDSYIKNYGFDGLWLDETELDFSPENDVFYLGAGVRYFNVYPLFFTSACYEGIRRDFGDSRRAMLLVRAAYHGTQRNGTLFWSGDIMPTWDMLKRSVPAGLHFTATGFAYWGTDIAGFFPPVSNHAPVSAPLIDPNSTGVFSGDADYTELYVRWFEYGTFQPIMRTHGMREQNEVWSYGKEAEPILSKYLRMRYQLLPYIYAQAYKTFQTGAPYMRALFMDFPDDATAVRVADEYMFGPALLVAPVTEQGATRREVYLPANATWYNYWTSERFRGGQTIEVEAPIDTIPLFVRAGSILPLGASIVSTRQKQAISTVLVYPGADASFALYDDDGNTYGYERGLNAITTLRWDDKKRILTHAGSGAWGKNTTVRVVGQ
jgi:alpha-glucosidase/alpha-D-xyloside xylohydrolase